MDGEEDNDGAEGVCAMELGELETWPTHQSQGHQTKDSHNMLFLTVEYVAEANDGFESFETTDAQPFPDVGEDSSLPCLSSLDPVYAVNNKSVIVVNGEDSSTAGCSTDLNPETSSNGATLLHSLPVIVSPPSVASHPTVLDSYSSPLPPPDSGLDSVSGSASSNQQPRRIIINNVCSRDGTTMQLDSLLSFDGSLLPTQNTEMLDSRFHSPSLDRVELVLSCSDENGVPYSLDTGMFSLRPQLNPDACPFLISKGAHLVLEQGDDGELHVRKSNLASEDCFQDLVEADSRLLDTIPHQIQLSSLIDDLSNKTDERIEELKAIEAFNSQSQMYIQHTDHASFSSVIVEDRGQTDDVSSKISNTLTVGAQTNDCGKINSCHDQVTRHRPVLAEKIFTTENKLNFSNDDLIKASSKKTQELSDSCWNGDCSRCLSGECLEDCTKSLSEKTHAWTSLPNTVLEIRKFTDQLIGQVVTGVFARKTIPKNTEFGPLEGLIVKSENHKLKKKIALPNLEYLIELENGTMLTVDLSDENHSNWMKFVRAAYSSLEQNISISQHGEFLYFRTLRDIEPTDELLAWYSHTYAISRDLPLEPPPKKLWTCFKCNETFTNSVDVQKHLNNHENEADENENVSLHVEKRNNFINAHVIKTPDKETEKMAHQCTTCKRVFPRNYSLKRHMLMHSRERKVTCSKCNAKFGDVAAKERHMRTVHRVEAGKKVGKSFQSALDFSLCNSWMCSKCSLMFNKPTLLSLHSLTHRHVITLFDSKACEYRLENGQFRCPECSLVFTVLQSLVDHVSVHGKIRSKSKRKADPSKPFRCLECFKGLANEERLQQHMLVHGSEESKPKQCTICLKRFLNNSALACHVKTHTNQSKVWDCPICKQTFEHVIALREHTVTHSNNGCFTCPFCKKLFTGYGPVRKHIRSFHNECPLKCMLCNHVFPTHDKLRMHMLRHSDHREFLCANCGKQFKRKDKLNEHMKRAHEEEQSPKVITSSIVDEKPAKPKKKPRKSQKVVETSLNDYERYVFKCHPCLQGFKRRGMLVNHLAKRHPNIPPEEVPELNLPIMKMTRDYFCQYCEKVYKSSSKRKAHILKCHPGSELPVNKPVPSNQQSNPPFTQTAGTETKQPQSCTWCYKQYATKAKLLQHQRKKHADKSCPEVRKPIKSKSHKPAVVEVATQNEPSANGENVILAACTMTLLDSVQEYHNSEPPNDCETLKAEAEHNTGDESSDLLSQAMSEFVNDTEYRAHYIDLQYHPLGTPHIVVPKTMYTPYPPR